MQINESTITRLLALQRETGSYDPRPLNNGRKPRLDEEAFQAIRERIEEQPDITLQELIDGLGLPVSAPALCKAINTKLGFVCKKTARAAEQHRQDVAERRCTRRAGQNTWEAARLVFLDECGVNTGMTRPYGRAYRHQRVVEAVPDTRFHRTSILSSARLDGTMIPVVFAGALNGDIFRTYVEQMLSPSLREGDNVVMNNLSSRVCPEICVNAE